jgi:hypothetical protein
MRSVDEICDWLSFFGGEWRGNLDFARLGWAGFACRRGIRGHTYRVCDGEEERDITFNWTSPRWWFRRFATFWS